MSKPWDSLRSEAPIKTGKFRLCQGATVHVTDVTNSTMSLGIAADFSTPTTRTFSKSELLEMAEFCQTAAKQLR